MHDELRNTVPKKLRLIKGIPRHLKIRCEPVKFSIMFKYWNEGELAVFCSKEHKLPDGKHCCIKKKNPIKINMPYVSESENNDFIYMTVLSPTGLNIDMAGYFGEIEKKDMLV